MLPYERGFPCPERERARHNDVIKLQGFNSTVTPLNINSNSIRLPSNRLHFSLTVDLDRERLTQLLPQTGVSILKPPDLSSHGCSGELMNVSIGHVLYKPIS